VPYVMKKWGMKVYTIAADYNYGQITSAWVKAAGSQLAGARPCGGRACPFHVPPLIVRAMTPLWSPCTATARSAADFRTLQKRPRREVVHGVGVGSNAGDPFVCLFDYLFSLRWHRSDCRVRFGCVRLTQGAYCKALEALRGLIFFLKQSLLIVADSLGRGQHGRSLQSELPWPSSDRSTGVD
jgi:hypothetical protein